MYLARHIFVYSILAGPFLPACSLSDLPTTSTQLLGVADRLEIVSPGPTSLGILPPGCPANGRLTVKNSTAASIKIARVETSCPCITVPHLPVAIASGTEHVLTVSFDPRADPDFRGGLSIDLKGYDPDGNVLFACRIEFEVRSLSSGEQSIPSRDMGTLIGTY
jgi:hypothetical protein